MAKLSTNTIITADGNYDWDTIPGRQYLFSLHYVAGTGTVTVQREQAGDGTYSEYKLPTDPTAAMALAASGTELGYAVKATGKTIRFVVSSASSLQLSIKVFDSQ